MLALQSVKDGMSICRASQTYKIPKGTLYNKIIGRTPIQCSMGHPADLTAEEEKDIVQ